MPELSENALSVCQKRYFFTEDEGWESCSKRSGFHVGQIEQDRSYIEKFSFSNSPFILRKISYL